jgi:hypothetical protein
VPGSSSAGRAGRDLTDARAHIASPGRPAPEDRLRPRVPPSGESVGAARASGTWAAGKIRRRVRRPSSDLSRAVLLVAGLLHARAGRDLADARAPLDSPCRPLPKIASALAFHRRVKARGQLEPRAPGRPGKIRRRVRRPSSDLSRAVLLEGRRSSISGTPRSSSGTLHSRRHPLANFSVRRQRHGSLPCLSAARHLSLSPPRTQSGRTPPPLARIAPPWSGRPRKCGRVATTASDTHERRRRESVGVGPRSAPADRLRWKLLGEAEHAGMPGCLGPAAVASERRPLKWLWRVARPAAYATPSG